MIINVLECSGDDDCGELSDTCNVGTCMCGRNPKCSNITSDTCDTGTCRCGSNAECEDETCISGVCKGKFF